MNTDRIETSTIVPGLAIESLAPIGSGEPETREAEWSFPVRLEQANVAGLVTPDFYVIGTFADGDRIVGGYKKQSLVENVRLVEAFESALDRLGIKFERSITVTHGGARMKADYRLVGIQTESLLHSPCDTILSISNSYDGTLKLTLSLQVLVLLCLNGLEGFADAVALQKKHGPEIDLSLFVQRVTEILDSRDGQAEGFERMAEKALPFHIAPRFFGNLAQASKGAIAPRLATHMLLNYHTPDSPESGLELTLWRAYMAGTRALRDLQETRPTVAEKANKALGQICYLAANPDISSWAKGAWSELTQRAPSDKFRLTAE